MSPAHECGEIPGQEPTPRTDAEWAALKVNCPQCIARRQGGSAVREYHVALDKTGRVAVVHLPLPWTAGDIQALRAWLDYLAPLTTPVVPPELRRLAYEATLGAMEAEMALGPPGLPKALWLTISLEERQRAMKAAPRVNHYRTYEGGSKGDVTFGTVCGRVFGWNDEVKKGEAGQLFNDASCNWDLTDCPACLAKRAPPT